MFGALNRFISRLDAEPTAQNAAQGPGDNSYGFQVLRNTNADLPIEPWFDFIIGLNGHLLDTPDPHLFATEVANCAGSTLSLELWSAKGQRTHTLTIAVPPASGTLGLSLQLAPLSSTQNIWHILTIPSPLSPAHLAGLLPHSDYILGTPSGTLRAESALGELVEDHLNRSLVLWVYNSEFDVVREVELVPRRGWGGEGALGAVLGFGALHRLPVGLGEELQAPSEKLFESERKSTDYVGNTHGDKGQFIVPAEMEHQVQPPPMISPIIAPPPMMSPNALSRSADLGPATAPSHGRKGPHHANVAPDRGFDDIFAEGAQKSLEEDYVPSRKNTPPPPPPKAGALASPTPPLAVVNPMPRPASGEQLATEAN